MNKEEIESIEIRLLLEAIYLRFGYDFRDYSEASMRRRLTKAVKDFGCTSFAEMQNRLLHDEQFFEGFLPSLTVTTSEMFRDPAFYKVLRESVFPVLKTYPSIRIWHAGCSTGEEVYSMAIALTEAGLYDRTTIYATDINKVAMKQAKSGVYDASRIKEFTQNYQKAGGGLPFSDYYTAGYGSVKFDSSLGRNLVFAEHNLATDEIFSDFHLIVCRNVLIYFDRPLQNRVLNLFANSLCHRGFLCLGSKESLRFVSAGEFYDDFNEKHRIFRRTAAFQAVQLFGRENL